MVNSGHKTNSKHGSEDKPQVATAWNCRKPCPLSKSLEFLEILMNFILLFCKRKGLHLNSLILPNSEFFCSRVFWLHMCGANWGELIRHFNMTVTLAGRESLSNLKPTFACLQFQTLSWLRWLAHTERAWNQELFWSHWWLNLGNGTKITFPAHKSC